MIFSRRQIIRMLTEAHPYLRKEDELDLSGNLDADDPNLSISAMWELAVRWCFAKYLEVRPHNLKQATGKNPDAELDLGLDRRVVVDVKSLSGDTFEFRSLLDGATNKIKLLFDELVPEADFSYRIQYGSSIDSRRYTRRMPYVCLDPTADARFKAEFEKMVKSGADAYRIKIPGTISATFCKVGNPSSHFPYQTTIPPLIQRADNEQSKRAVKQAVEQLGPFAQTHYRGLILCDGGTSSLGGNDSFHDWVNSNSQEMVRYIVDSAGLDFAFALGRRDGLDFGPFLGKEAPRLATRMFASSDLDPKTADQIASQVCYALAHIPVPSVQLRSAKERMRLNRNTGQAVKYFLPSLISGHIGEVDVKISAKALMEFLTGAMSESDFRQHIRSFSEPVPLNNVRRMRIGNARFEALEDSDDDYVVLTLIESWDDSDYRDQVKRLRSRDRRPPD